MPEPLKLKYTPTVEEFASANCEYCKLTHQSNEVIKRFAIIFGITVIVLGIITLVHLLLFSPAGTAPIIQIGNHVFQRLIIVPWGFFILLGIIFIRGNAISKTPDYTTQFITNPILHATKHLDFSKDYIHEQTSYYEYWFTKDAIKRIIKTKTFYYLVTFGDLLITYLPIHIVHERARRYLEAIMEKGDTGASNDKKTRRKVLDNLIQPEPVGINIHIKQKSDLNTDIWKVVDQSLSFPLMYQYVRFGFMICFIYLFFALWMDTLYLIYPLSFRFTNIITALIILTLYWLCILLWNIISCIIRYSKKKDIPESEYIIDELGIFFGNGKVNIGVYWPAVNKIRRTKHNYHLLSGILFFAFSLPLQWLTKKDNNQINLIFEKALSINPCIKLNYKL